jgi:hypothetical protein
MQAQTKRVLYRAVLALALSVAAVGLPRAQDQGAVKQIIGPNPESRKSIRLFLDPDLKRPHNAISLATSGTKFPRPVMEEAPNGAVKTLVEISGGGMAEVWLHPSEVKTDLRADGNCLLAQRATGPIGATRGANETCVGAKK